MKMVHPSTHIKTGVKINLSLKCYFCEERFSSTEDRRKHCFSAHNKRDEVVSATTVRCMICENIVKKKQLIGHRRTHLEKKVECSLCFIQLKKSSRKAHEENIHISEEEKHFLKTGEGSFEIDCSKCPRKLLNEKSLEIHTQKVHTSNEIRCTLGCSISHGSAVSMPRM